VTAGCPSPAELLLHALDRRDPATEDITRHLTGCPSCRAEVRHLRDTAAALRHLPEPDVRDIGQCFDELTIASIVDGELRAADHRHVIAHLAACPRCRTQVASVARLLRDPFVAEAQQEVQRSAPPYRGVRVGSGGRRIAGMSALTGLAAAAIVLVAVRSDSPSGSSSVAGRTSGTPVYREQAVTTTAAPRVIAPIGVVPAVDSLRWTSVPHADRYRVTVFDRHGNTAHEAQTADTALALPARVAFARGELYLWKVEARTGWDRWVESELVEFTVSSAQRPER
jgi:anti-sigma factor RsiW